MAFAFAAIAFLTFSLVSCGNSYVPDDCDIVCGSDGPTEESGESSTALTTKDNLIDRFEEWIISGDPTGNDVIGFEASSETDHRILTVACFPTNPDRRFSFSEQFHDEKFRFVFEFDRFGSASCQSDDADRTVEVVLSLFDKEDNLAIRGAFEYQVDRADGFILSGDEVYDLSPGCQPEFLREFLNRSAKISDMMDDIRFFFEERGMGELWEAFFGENAPADD